MTSVSKRSLGFTSSSVYRRREPHAFKYLSERATFWIAVLSVFAFVTGNMIGQHGWAVFWKSVMGEGSESTIVFTGMVPPIEQVPDFERWGRLGGSVHTHTFRQVPKDLLVPLPRYLHHDDDVSADPTLRMVYFTEHLGTYETGRGKGSHAGTDISAPTGTPVVSVANGIVTRVDNDPSGFGNYIVVKHPNIPDVEEKGKKGAIYSVYAHLSDALVAEGVTVKKGEQIGLSGKTGFASAPHLHFQMERESAPFHPYWPFSGAEQREAKLTFVQAVNQGLNRGNGIAHLFDPMLIVQSYESYTAPAIAAVPQTSSSASSKRPLTIAERRQLRLAKLPTFSSSPAVTLVAFHDATENHVILPPASSSAASSPAAPVGIGAVKSVRVSHDGSFNKARGWERVTLMLMDSDGRVVTSPSSSEKLHLLTAYGRAEFKPAIVSLADFKNGAMVVEMLPLGEQTVIIQVQPTRDMSMPMKYSR